MWVIVTKASGYLTAGRVLPSRGILKCYGGSFVCTVQRNVILNYNNMKSKGWEDSSKFKDHLSCCLVGSFLRKEEEKKDPPLVTEVMLLLGLLLV